MDASAWARSFGMEPPPDCADCEGGCYGQDDPRCLKRQYAEAGGRPHGGTMIRTYGTAKPINPDEAVGSKCDQIPDAVIEEFNRLIVRALHSGQAGVSQDEVLDALEGRGFSRREVLDNRWLDVEGLYRLVGWEVEYIKPDPDQSFRAFFRFTHKAQK